MTEAASHTSPRVTRELRPPSAVATLGIIGGGQLAKMTAQAAAQLGCDVVVLERTDDFPAHSVDSHAIVGDWNDPAKLLDLARVVDVVTLENEFVDADALAAVERAGRELHPSSATMRLVQDKLVQKETFARAGLPVPRFRAVETPSDVALAARDLGWPLVLKRRRGGYDGKGNALVEDSNGVAAAWAKLAGAPNVLYVEELCRFEAELAQMLVRGRDGACAAYPVVETVQRDHVCHVVHAPAKGFADASERVARMTRTAVEAIGGVGAFGLELFLLPSGELVLNEIAPRVHNSGHYTIEACATSQFENHVRAVLGLPLGSVAMRMPNACMVNLLGAGSGSGEPIGLREALAVAGAQVHVYGKKKSERGRKMGHVTALGGSREEAFTTARTAADVLRFGGA